MLPGWFGVGTALRRWVEGEVSDVSSGSAGVSGAGGTSAAGVSPEERLATLRRLYADWPFLRTTLSNMAQVMAKADMDLAGRYASLVPDPEVGRRIHRVISDEFELSREMLLAVTGHETLLDDNPALARSVRNRFRIWSLNVLQVELLRRYRAGIRPAGAHRHPADHERPGHGVAQLRLTRPAPPDPSGPRRRVFRPRAPPRPR